MPQSYLDAALKLAAHGFRVFKCQPNGKLPATEDFPNVATTDSNKIRAIWVDPLLELEQPYNVGIAMGRGLMAVDVDVKDGKKGHDSLLIFESEGKIFPPTYTQVTPTGSIHYVYRTTATIRNSVCKLAPGLDIRGDGGYLVGCGSRLDGRSYTSNWEGISDAPRWLIEAIARVAPTARQIEAPTTSVDTAYARKRGLQYVRQSVGVLQGGRDAAAYAHAARLKDLGVYVLDALELLEEWADRCDPPLPHEELIAPVENAYRYAKDKGAIAAPEAHFDEVKEPEKLSPVEELNQEYAFIISGNSHHILRETTDEEGRPTLMHILEPTFHRMHAGRVMNIGENKMEAITKVWMNSRNRRSFTKGFCFNPGKEAAPGYYNLYRGWAVKPADFDDATPNDVAAVDQFLEHAKMNVCAGDEDLYKWLISFFAHMFQRPWEKPHTALVMKGLKGVGKNALVDTVGYLLGIHYTLVSDSRYLVGNFNGHLENLLMFTLDEAFWSGSKEAEGRLKDLVTGKTHKIERKGKESYDVKNCTRVVILGNEDWLVPASWDERRYAVFTVGDGRRQDTKFFGEMIGRMEMGGYCYLLQFFLEYDIKGFNPNVAPLTEGLYDQKIASMDLLSNWWHEGLVDGELPCTESNGEWLQKIGKNELRDAFSRYCKKRNATGWTPSAVGFGRKLKECCALANVGKMQLGDRWINCYDLPDLSLARQEWDMKSGHSTKWEE